MTHNLIWYFDIQTDHLILARRPDHMLINKNGELTELWPLVSRLTTEKKSKESEKEDKYHNFARELKKLGNMKVAIILIVIGALSIVIKLIN